MASQSDNWARGCQYIRKYVQIYDPLQFLYPCISSGSYISIVQPSMTKTTQQHLASCSILKTVGLDQGIGVQTGSPPQNLFKEEAKGALSKSIRPNKILLVAGTYCDYKPRERLSAPFQIQKGQKNSACSVNALSNPKKFCLRHCLTLKPSSGYNSHGFPCTQMEPISFSCDKVLDDDSVMTMSSPSKFLPEQKMIRLIPSPSPPLFAISLKKNQTKDMYSTLLQKILLHTPFRRRLS